MPLNPFAIAGLEQQKRDARWLLYPNKEWQDIVKKRLEQPCVYEVHVTNSDGVWCIYSGPLSGAQDRVEDMARLGDTRQAAIVGPTQARGDNDPLPKLIRAFPF